MERLICEKKAIIVESSVSQHGLLLSVDARLFALRVDAPKALKIFKYAPLESCKAGTML